MQETSKEQLQKNFKVKNLSPEDRRNFVGYFELLIKVDKRVNPALYQPKKT